MVDSAREDSSGAGLFCCAETCKLACGTDRSASFQVMSGVVIHGGFDPAVGRNWQVFAGSRSSGQTDP